MNRLDRYIFEQLLGPFGFFALVYTGIFWLAQSIRLIEIVISNDQSVWELLEVSALILPTVMMFVIPLSAFSAALYTSNRLYAESELVVILTAGQSPWSLARAMAVFGVLAMVITAVVTLYLLPIGATRLANRLAEFRQEYANSIVREGQFVHPSDGVTLYVREANARGEMLGIFINDASDPSDEVTYSADRAVLVSEREVSQIVMFDGTAQHHAAGSDRFETVGFDRLSYDLSEFIRQGVRRSRSPREYFAHEGFNPEEGLVTRRNTLGRFVSEAHDKVTTPLIALSLPMLALGGVLAGSFQRGGFAFRMILSIGLVIIIEALAISMKSAVRADPSSWQFAYVAPAFSLIAAICLIANASRKKSRRMASRAASA